LGPPSQLINQLTNQLPKKSPTEDSAGHTGPGDNENHQASL